jgi:hypothetical protein
MIMSPALLLTGLLCVPPWLFGHLGARAWRWVVMGMLRSWLSMAPMPEAWRLLRVVRIVKSVMNGLRQNTARM